MFLDKVMVSRNSWHYKWLCSYRNRFWYAPDDFCTYFWLLVFQALVFIGCSVGAGFLASAYIAWWLTAWKEALAATSVVVGVFAVAAGAIYFLAYMDYVGREKLSNSVVITYVRAKKEKYCPIVEYKD